MDKKDQNNQRSYPGHDWDIPRLYTFISELMDNITCAVAIYHAVDNGENFIFKAFNKKAQLIENTKEEDILGKKVTDVFPGVVELGLFEVFKRVWKTGKPETHPISFYKDDKLAGWRENLVYKLDSGDIMAIYTDMTKQKQVETELIEANKNLREMIYITSHDLQSPLISIEGYASELVENYSNVLDENGRYCLNRLKSNTQRMHALIISLLDISRLNTQKFIFESFDSEDMINSIKEDLGIMLENSKAELIFRKIPTLYGDKNRLTVVFRQLIANALLYGGKHIIVGHSNDTWFIKDDGIGIPPDQLARIFNPGERLKQNEAEGSGMGLTFCKTVIARHNGKIWAESEGIGKGSTFYFTIKI